VAQALLQRVDRRNGREREHPFSSSINCLAPKIRKRRCAGKRMKKTRHRLTTSSVVRNSANATSLKTEGGGKGGERRRHCPCDSQGQDAVY